MYVVLTWDVGGAPTSNSTENDFRSDEGASIMTYRHFGRSTDQDVERTHLGHGDYIRGCASLLEAPVMIP